ncbi:MAG: hypothetical protein QM739_11885 [Propionivibrio sp.]
MNPSDSSDHDDDKLRCADELRRHLQAAKALRRMANEAPEAARRRLLLREWQAARLSRSYPDLLASERFGKAARFFLSDLYGPKDFSSRDEEVERIMPLLLSILPLSALQTLSLAIEVDALSEEFDAAMIAELGKAGCFKSACDIDAISDAAYAKAYRKVGRRLDRERQIDLIGATGKALDRLAKKPLLTTLLRIMRGPAHLAGLGDLHEFLESGFDAFRHMGDAHKFLDTIDTRERRVLENLFGGATRPFAA